VYAARRLAEGFAEEREWDIVDVVARRTIDGEGGLDARMNNEDAIVTGRYLPTNMGLESCRCGRACKSLVLSRHISVSPNGTNAGA
jgi:hypothetical protein